jgi:sortase A
MAPHDRHRTLQIRCDGFNAARGDPLANIVQSVGRVLMLIGLALLSSWGAAQLHGIFGSRAAIAKFRAAEVASSPSNYQTTAGIVDFRLWSPTRISAYRESLAKEAAGPQAILRIARINLEAPVFEGTDDLTLNRGVGRIIGTARFGQSGNIGIAGHRDGFFRGLQNVTKGDVVELERPGMTFRYVVSQIDVVTPQDTEVLNPTATPTVTLVTCFPFYFVGSAPKRFVVRAILEEQGQSHIDRNNDSDNTRDRGGKK